MKILNIYSIKKNKNGMTLVEIILALTLLALVTIPLTAGFSMTLTTVKKTREQIELNMVTKIVRERVETKITKEILRNGSTETSVKNLDIFKQSHISIPWGADAEVEKVLSLYSYDAEITELQLSDSKKKNIFKVKVYKKDFSNAFKLKQTLNLEIYPNNEG